MRLRQIAPFIGVLGILPVLYLLFPRRDLADGLGDFSGWRPSENEITAAVGKGGGVYTDARHTLFAHLFQQRFRDRTYAVGVRFVSPTRIKAMFAPIIPRWDMARVAVDARRQAHDIFGTDYDVDVYETYITAPMIKVAELRAAPQTNRPTIVFDPRFQEETFARYIRAARAHRTKRPASHRPLLLRSMLSVGTLVRAN